MIFPPHASLFNKLKRILPTSLLNNEEIITLFSILLIFINFISLRYILINFMSLNLWQSIMRKINPKSSNINSFKYSILISLYYYDISFHSERTSKLKPFENKNNFTYITPNEFEINNCNISLIVFDENNNIIHLSKNNSINKTHIVKMNNRYTAVKPLKNKFIKLNKLFESFSRLELRQHIIQNILKNKIEGIEFET